MFLKKLISITLIVCLVPLAAFSRSTEKTLERLCKSTNWEDRWVCARDKTGEASVYLESLSRDKYYPVRMSTAANQKTPTDVLIRLASDRVKKVRDVANKYLASRYNNSDAVVLGSDTNEPSQAVLENRMPSFPRASFETSFSLASYRKAKAETFPSVVDESASVMPSESEIIWEKTPPSAPVVIVDCQTALTAESKIPAVELPIKEIVVKIPEVKTTQNVVFNPESESLKPLEKNNDIEKPALADQVKVGIRINAKDIVAEEQENAVREINKRIVAPESKKVTITKEDLIQKDEQGNRDEVNKIETHGGTAIQTGLRW